MPLEGEAAADAVDVDSLPEYKKFRAYNTVREAKKKDMLVLHVPGDVGVVKVVSELGAMGFPARSSTLFTLTVNCVFEGGIVVNRSSTNALPIIWFAEKDRVLAGLAVSNTS